MAAPAWSEDLTDIYVGGAGNFSALGGGASGLNTETDYFIQGTDCQSKNAWTNDIKGLIHDNGSSFTVPTTGAIVAWLYYAAVNALENKAGVSPDFNGGLMLIEGSASNAYNRYNVAGADTLPFDSWIPYVVDPNTATADDTVGSPSGTEQWVGVEANLPTTAGPTKGAPIAIDAVRYGRCTLTYTEGDSGNGFNTFSGAENTANSISNRWGLIEFRQGAYYVQGFHLFGKGDSPTALVDFRDSNKIVFIRDTEYVATGFNRFEIANSSSNVEWNNILFQALGTQSPGTFVHTAGTFLVTNCQFVDVGTFSLLSTSDMLNCIFRNTGIITAPGSDLTGSSITGFEGTAGTSSLIWDVNTDPDGLIDSMTFEKGVAATHAIEFGTNVPTTMTIQNINFSGYNASNGQNDSNFHFKDTSGTSITLNCTGCIGNLSYTTDGADITIVADPATTTVTVNDHLGAPLINARVILRAANSTGPLPYNDIVTISISGITATVTHTAHGLLSGQKVEIQGASYAPFNGVKTITNVTTNSYDYTVDSGSPAVENNYRFDSVETVSPISYRFSAQGEGGIDITSTGVILEGLTDSSGQIIDARTLSSNQPVSGVVRTGSSTPRYKDFPISGIVDTLTGLSINVTLILDE
jgi:hypothetical protein